MVNVGWLLAVHIWSISWELRIYSLDASTGAAEMTPPEKTLTSEHIRVLKTLCEKHPQSDLARALATIEQQAEQIEKLLELLREAKKHGNFRYSKRVGGQNEGYCDFVDALDEALASTEPVNDKR